MTSTSAGLASAGFSRGARGRSVPTRSLARHRRSRLIAAVANKKGNEGENSAGTSAWRVARVTIASQERSRDQFCRLRDPLDVSDTYANMCSYCDRLRSHPPLRCGSPLRAGRGAGAAGGAGARAWRAAGGRRGLGGGGGVRDPRGHAPRRGARPLPRLVLVAPAPAGAGEFGSGRWGGWRRSGRRWSRLVPGRRSSRSRALRALWGVRRVLGKGAPAARAAGAAGRRPDPALRSRGRAPGARPEGAGVVPAGPPGLLAAQPVGVLRERLVAELGAGERRARCDEAEAVLLGHARAAGGTNARRAGFAAGRGGGGPLRRAGAAGAADGRRRRGAAAPAPAPEPLAARLELPEGGFG